VRVTEVQACPRSRAVLTRAYPLTRDARPRLVIWCVLTGVQPRFSIELLCVLRLPGCVGGAEAQALQKSCR
jgi:hypothetical protein